MPRPYLRFAIALILGLLLLSTSAEGQLVTSMKKARSVRILKGPEIERVDPDFAIIRWTSDNPGGSLEHFGVVRYGTDPKNLDQTAKSHIRLNINHSETVFRVRMPDLKPKTTYYYAVDSMEPNGTSDGVKSPVKKFTTPPS
jgi:hypothetical protein